MTCLGWILVHSQCDEDYKHNFILKCNCPFDCTTAAMSYEWARKLVIRTSRVAVVPLTARSKIQKNCRSTEGCSKFKVRKHDKFGRIWSQYKNKINLSPKYDRTSCPDE